MATAAQLQARAAACLAQAQAMTAPAAAAPPAVPGMGAVPGGLPGLDTREQLPLNPVPQPVATTPDQEWHTDQYGNSRKICRRFRDTGECGYGLKCVFAHIRMNMLYNGLLKAYPHMVRKGGAAAAAGMPTVAQAFPGAAVAQAFPDGGTITNIVESPTADPACTALVPATKTVEQKIGGRQLDFHGIKNTIRGVLVGIWCLRPLASRLIARVNGEEKTPLLWDAGVFPAGLHEEALELFLYLHLKCKNAAGEELGSEGSKIAFKMCVDLMIEQGVLKMKDVEDVDEIPTTVAVAKKADEDKHFDYEKFMAGVATLLESKTKGIQDTLGAKVTELQARVEGKEVKASSAIFQRRVRGGEGSLFTPDSAAASTTAGSDPSGGASAGSMELTGTSPSGNDRRKKAGKTAAGDAASSSAKDTAAAASLLFRGGASAGSGSSGSGSGAPAARKHLATRLFPGGEEEEAEDSLLERMRLMKKQEDEFAAMMERKAAEHAEQMATAEARIAEQRERAESAYAHAERVQAEAEVRAREAAALAESKRAGEARAAAIAAREAAAAVASEEAKREAELLENQAEAQRAAAEAARLEAIRVREEALRQEEERKRIETAAKQQAEIAKSSAAAKAAEAEARKQRVAQEEHRLQAQEETLTKLRAEREAREKQQSDGTGVPVPRTLAEVAASAAGTPDAWQESNRYHRTQQQQPEMAQQLKAEANADAIEEKSDKIKEMGKYEDMLNSAVGRINTDSMIEFVDNNPLLHLDPDMYATVAVVPRLPGRDMVVLSKKMFMQWLLSFSLGEIAEAMRILPKVVKWWNVYSSAAKRFEACLRTFNHQYVSRLRRTNLVTALALLIGRNSLRIGAKLDVEITGPTEAQKKKRIAETRAKAQLMKDQETAGITESAGPGAPGVAAVGVRMRPPPPPPPPRSVPSPFPEMPAAVPQSRAPVGTAVSGGAAKPDATKATKLRTPPPRAGAVKSPTVGNLFERAKAVRSSAATDEAATTHAEAVAAATRVPLKDDAKDLEEAGEVEAPTVLPPRRRKVILAGRRPGAAPWKTGNGAASSSSAKTNRTKDAMDGAAMWFVSGGEDEERVLEDPYGGDGDDDDTEDYGEEEEYEGIEEEVAKAPSPQRLPGSKKRR